MINTVKEIKEKPLTATKLPSDFSPTLEKYQDHSNISIFTFQVFSHKNSLKLQKTFYKWRACKIANKTI